MMNKDREWRVRSYQIPANQWVIVDASWTAKDGLKLYVNDSSAISDVIGRPRRQPVSKFVYT